jgi:hypothetical protein
MNLKPVMVAASLALGCLLTAGARAAEPRLPRDGWVSWEVSAPEGTPFWCCWSSWDERVAARKPCQLDERNYGYGTRREGDTTDAARVYARTTGGKIDRLQVLAAACPVESKTPIRELADITSPDSIHWLAAQAKQGAVSTSDDESLAQHALAAIAMHRGDLARDELTAFARNDSRVEARKWAVFWMAMMRGAEGADIASSVMFADASTEVRKHAALAMAHNKSPRVAPDLIRLGNTDQDDDVRAQAWFWLAQSARPEAEQAINQALRKDGSEHVREQAVFALSQLPDERAAKALIAAAEDRSLSRAQRKRAVFWLSQSESDSAQAYLEKVLTVSAH